MTNIPVSERTKWIGASEVAGLLGVSPYTTAFQLYHEKVGNIPIESLDGVERIMAGQFLEPAIGAWAATKWGWKITPFKSYLNHPDIERFGCSLGRRQSNYVHASNKP